MKEEFKLDTSDWDKFLGLDSSISSLLTVEAYTENGKFIFIDNNNLDKQKEPKEDEQCVEQHKLERIDMQDLSDKKMIIDLSEWNEYGYKEIHSAEVPEAIQLETMQIITADSYIDDSLTKLQSEIKSVNVRLFWRVKK